MTSIRGRVRTAAIVMCALAVLGCGAGTTAAGAAGSDASTVKAPAPARAFQWPAAAPIRLAQPFIAPPHAYGPGHRGLDITILGDASIRAPADGVVAFAGPVVDRGVVTIAHRGGLVSSLEPVDPTIAAGVAVMRGDVVGTLSNGGHALPGRLHWGMRLDGEYINPLLLVGGVPRAVLLPLDG